MSRCGPIALFDSGVGGLSVWREIVRQIPAADTLYLADQAHLPYGSRSLEQVCTFAQGITRFLLERGAGTIVLACNTISAAALHDLRRLLPGVSFVGMEPAIKPATEQTRTGVVGVIATRVTFQGKLFADLLARYAGEVRVLTQACPGLVEAVEQGALLAAKTRTLLERYIVPMVRAGVDQLVLGCTHYPFLLPLVRQVVGQEVSVIDPAPAVARQASRVLLGCEPDLVPSPCTAGLQSHPARHLFFTSGDCHLFARQMELLLARVDGMPREVQTVSWRSGQLEED